MRREVARKTKEILLNEPYSRENDGYLIRRVVEELEPNLYKTNFKNIMDNLKFYGISTESICRARRKFFEENPQLRIKKAEEARRKKEEEYFLEYGNHIPKIN